ncbi:MAG TPA: hypothetical protein VG722_06160, partial [Tepidisphaeraceae bacterium]|nr:hypothetical protein [Tepidisphaeraceae bacterium]
LGISRNATGLTKVGKGVVIYSDESPATLSRSENGGEQVDHLIQQAMSAIDVQWKEARALVLRRGPYIVASGLDSPPAGAPQVTLPGPFLSLFEPGLPVLSDYHVKPGSRALLVDLNAEPKVGIVAAACQVRNARVSDNAIAFDTDGIAKTRGIICMKIPTAPKSVMMEGEAVPSDQYEFKDGLLRLHLANSVKVRHVSVTW